MLYSINYNVTMYGISGQHEPIETLDSDLFVRNPRNYWMKVLYRKDDGHYHVGR